MNPKIGYKSPNYKNHSGFDQTISIYNFLGSLKTTNKCPRFGHLSTAVGESKMYRYILGFTYSCTLTVT